MNSMKYGALWFLEVMLVVALVLVLLVPVQDYAMREFKEYLRHPSPETLKAFQDKNQEEFRIRRNIAIPIAVVVAVLAIPIFRIRSRRNKVH